MKRLVIALTAAVSTLGFVPAANAATLVAGASGVAFDPFVAATRGVLLADLATSHVAVTYSADLRSAVYRNTSNTLDFYFQVAVTDIRPLDEVFNLTGFDFTGYTVDAFVDGTDFDGAGIFTAANNPNTNGAEPGGFTSTASRNGTGSVVRADFGANGLEAAGQTSATYIFRTNAVNFDRLGTFTTQDGSTITRPNFQPAAPVPEPATWAMLLVGFGGIGFAMRRRKSDGSTQRVRVAYS